MTGDAEAEHLLLAAKVLSKVRRVVKVPMDEAIKRQAEDIVLAEWPELAMPVPDQGGIATDDEDEDEDEVDYADAGNQSGALADNRASPAAVIATNGKGKEREAQNAEEGDNATPSSSTGQDTQMDSAETGSATKSKKRRRSQGACNDSDRVAAWRPASARVLQQVAGSAGDDETSDTFGALDVLAQASVSQSDPRTDTNAQARPSRPVSSSTHR